jgi:signal transduction histidine kinase
MPHQESPHPDHRPVSPGPLRLSPGRAERPDAVDGPFAVERLTKLTHDLNGLLDGSLRWLGLARGSLAAARAAAGDAPLERASRQIETVYAALERMADLVHAAMRSSGSVVGSVTITPTHPITIAEAVQHAADVVTPEAEEHGVSVGVMVSPEAAGKGAGPLYSVLLNGFRNALESVLRARQRDGCGGEIRGSVRLEPVGDQTGGGVDLLLIEIRDDGAGLESAAQGAEAFDFGYSTKPGGLGVGLALAREIVREVGGTIELLPARPAGTSRRPGAVLRVVYPVVRTRRDIKGGADA